ncbi:HxsD-like protein [Candidatus Woesearchaeota archaeon]|nr:HxsD-like protein [Candidatus Woesearchaeota archaeon]
MTQESNLTLSKRFYQHKTLLRAKERFRGTAEFRIEETHQAYMISVSHNRTDQPETILLREFANHCLAEEKNTENEDG